MFAVGKSQLDTKLFAFKIFRDAQLDRVIQLEFFEGDAHLQLQIRQVRMPPLVQLLMNGIVFFVGGTLRIVQDGLDFLPIEDFMRFKMIAVRRVIGQFQNFTDFIDAGAQGFEDSGGRLAAGFIPSQ